MPHALIILGVFLALAGIGSIAAGAPSWALGLGLGSALIQSGAVGLVGGFLLVGIGFVLRALRDLSRRMDMIASGASVAPPARAPVAAPPPPRAAPAKREPARREPPPFAGREASRESALLDRQDAGDYPEAAERGRPPRSWPPESETRTPARAPLTADRGRERIRPPLERAPLTERAPAYEDDYQEEPAVRSAPAGMSTTVVRSGIISGMAYTLYTDGSIEAELPIGTVRFSSIEELQDHVSQTGEDADIDFGNSHTPKI